MVSLGDTFRNCVERGGGLLNFLAHKWGAKQRLFLLPVDIVNLVHMCLGTNIRASRQFNMFMSENICTMVDLFDKAVADPGVR